MKFRTLISMSAVSVLGLLFLPVRPAAQEQPPTSSENHSRNTRYAVTDLGQVGGPPGQPYFIAKNGLVSGAAAVPNGSMQAVLWFNGLKLDIGAPGLGGAHSVAFGVNEEGQAVGEAETSFPNGEDFCGFNAFGLLPTATRCRPFLWQHGAMTRLPTLGGPNGVATSINNRGLVAGFAETTLRDPDPACSVFQFKPVIWGKMAGYGNSPLSATRSESRPRSTTTVRSSGRRARVPLSTRTPDSIWWKIAPCSGKTAW